MEQSSNNVVDLYYKWLCSTVFPDEEVRLQYSYVLWVLYTSPFTYEMKMDSNRFSDGVNLRYIFSSRTGIPYQIVIDCFDNNFCSILEMMVALAQRCEDSLMYDSTYGDRTHVWFWHMFCNLGLNEYANDNLPYDIDDILAFKLKMLCDRRYAQDGTGGLFHVVGYPDDMRQLELWQQMQVYMTNYIHANTDYLQGG